MVRDLGTPVDAGAAGMDAAVLLDASGPDAGPVDDQDGDGLVDAVDPDPRRANPLLFEDAFDDRAQTWIFSSVSMAIDTQQSVLSVRRIEPFEREGWIGPMPTWSDYIVQARLRITGTGNSSRPESGHAGLFARAEQVTPSRYVTCGMDLRTERMILAEHQGTRVIDLGEAPAPVPAGDWVVVTLVARGDIYTCDVEGTRLTGRSDTLIGGSVGFRSFDATFDADWIRVYDL